MPSIEDRIDVLEWKVEAIRIKTALAQSYSPEAEEEYKKHLKNAPRMILDEVSEPRKETENE